MVLAVRGVKFEVGKKDKGSLKGCGVPEPSKKGYRDTWDMGRASNNKKRSRLSGPNRPST